MRNMRMLLFLPLLIVLALVAGLVLAQVEDDQRAPEITVVIFTIPDRVVEEVGAIPQAWGVWSEAPAPHARNCECGDCCHGLRTERYAEDRGIHPVLAWRASGRFRWTAGEDPSLTLHR